MAVVSGGVPGPDFFVSYTQADRAWAEWIAWILEEDGHRVLVQAWDMVPGSNWIRRMQDGVSAATRTIAVLSPKYLESEYGTAEWQAAWAGDPSGTDRKLLVARVAECDRPGLLSGVVGVDFFGVSEADARARLRKMVADAVTGSARPGKAPPFPDGRAITREPRFPGALPRVWNVPARNPNFTGRADELTALEEALTSGAAVTVQAVRGMGGVGKSQLATEHAYARASDYDLVYWIAAEEPAAVPDQFAALARKLGLDGPPDPDSLREQVHARLRDVPGWLLIFDNADDAEDLRPWIPAGPRPPGIPGHVLITTRRRGGFSALGQVLELDVMPIGDAVALLRTRVPGIDSETATRLAAELGYLPLALEQAAAYLDQTAMDPGEYLELLRQRALDLYRKGRVAGRDDTIATLWDISLERINQLSPAAAELLDPCAYLAAEPIPLDLFTSHPDLLPPELSAAAADTLAFNDAIGVLADYSLAKHTPAGLQLHRLVQAAIRGHHNPVPGTAPAGHGDGADNGTPSQAAARPLSVAVSLLQADLPTQIMGRPENWPRWAALLPHVLAATSHADGAPGGHDGETGQDVVWLLDRAAAYLQVHARLAEARPLAERTLAIDEAAYGPDHPTVATHLNNLATILQDLGQAAAARPLAERALAITEAAHGPNHPDVATRLGNLATILQDLGQPEAAQELRARLRRRAADEEDDDDSRR